MSLDCDGFMEGAKQPAACLDLLARHGVQRPTCFVMATGDSEKTLYDPIYDVRHAEMRPFLEGDVEIGLHGSYLSYDREDILRAQKERLEQKTGKPVKGHRAHYLRNSFPASWGYLARLGFDYDMTMGFYDLAGNRHGTSEPVPVLNPSGSGGRIWSLSTGLMDQHLFYGAGRNSLQWSEEAGSPVLWRHLDRLASTGGIISLDWHVHAMNPTQFPFHAKALEEILSHVRDDGAAITGAGALIERYHENGFCQSLLDRATIRLAAGAGSGPLQTRHLEHYVDSASDAHLASVGYVDHAAASFLAVLPGDAVRIADVGCGTGWVSHRVPAFHQVVGIDIDQAILRNLTRPYAVGALPHLPLEDKSVDLVMSTDVCEHLSNDELLRARDEFDRVSTRYVYLQTPYRERLEDGSRNCSSCGTPHHVNHHLQSFDQEKLSSVMGKGWRVRAVNLTGETRVYDSSLRTRDGDLIGTPPLGDHSFDCRACGFRNLPLAPLGPSENLRLASKKADIPLPFYSEIGILFERDENAPPAPDTVACLETRQGQRKNLSRPIKTHCNEVDFTGFFIEQTDVSPQAVLPCVSVSNGAIKRRRGGIEVHGTTLSPLKTVFLVFPEQYPAGTRISIKGEVNQPVAAWITFEAFNWKLEYVGTSRRYLKGQFDVLLDLGAPAYCIALQIPHATQIVLKKAEVKREGDPLHVYDVGQIQHLSHLHMRKEGIDFRWLVGPGGYVAMDRPLPIGMDIREGGDRTDLPLMLHRCFSVTDAAIHDAESRDAQSSIHLFSVESEEPKRPAAQYRIQKGQLRPLILCVLKRYLPVYLKKKLKKIYFIISDWRYKL